MDDNDFINNEYSFIKDEYSSKKYTLNEIADKSCYHDCIELFVKKSHLHLSIKNGSYEIIKCLLKQKMNITVLEISLAIEQNNTTILNIFRNYGIKYNSYHTILAAERDKLECLIFFRDINVELDDSIGIVAGPNVLKWICQYGPIHELMVNRVIEVLNDVNILIKLYNEKIIINYNSQSLVIAREQNNSDIIKWLHEHGIKN